MKRSFVLRSLLGGLALLSVSSSAWSMTGSLAASPAWSPAGTSDSRSDSNLEPAGFSSGTHLGVGESLGFSPYWNWKTITTEHFRLSFPEELTEVAKRAALYCEQTHSVLSPVMRWTSPHRTQIVLTNNQDSANGLTSPIQRFGIVLYITPPDAFFSTDKYDDWLRLLIVHEYTHLLNMDATDSWVYNSLRFVFGDLILPNSTWPSWMLEGYAVYMETRYTKGGRGRSQYWDMLLRERVMSGKLDTPDSVTLDRVNGTYPWWPSGEVPYLYGYELINEAVRLAPQHESLLGEMSLASASRVPYFINGNLENLTSKDWYQVWDSWKERTQKRVHENLQKLGKVPFSKAQTIVKSDFQVMGSALSPDGQWLAYTEESTEQSAALWLMNRKTGVKRRLETKILGVGMSFTPDSKFVLFSSLRRKATYAVLSELAYARVSDGKVSWITSGWRARDPQLSPDGTHVVFTEVNGSSIGIAESPLKIVGGEPVLGPAHWLWNGSLLDRASNPIYIDQGKQVVFSLHENGKLQSDLVSVPVTHSQPIPKSEPIRTWISDGKSNRFPAYNSKKNELCYISDRTGIDNVFCLDHEKAQPKMVTHVATGIWLPVFDSNGTLHANLYGSSGWELATIETNEAGFNSFDLSIDARAAPQEPTAEESFAGTTPAAAQSFKTEDYSAFPSLWPRQWAPLFFAGSSGGTSIGGEVFGFDTADRHRYLLAGFYNSQNKHADWLAYYSNRSFGPNFNLYTQASHSFIEPTQRIVEQDWTVTASIDQPILFTESGLWPQIAISSERITDFSFLNGQSGRELLRDQLTELSVSMGYYQRENSRLSIAPESGRSIFLGTRGFNYLSNWVNWKLVGTYDEYFLLFDHWTLNPYLKYSHAAKFQNQALKANSIADGGERNPFSNLATNPLEQFRLLGYPRIRVYARDVGVVGGTLNFPVWRIFRGLGTDPIFLQQFSGYAFGQTIYLPKPILGSKRYLPAVGGGLRLDLNALINLPLQASINYEKGLDKDLAPSGETYFMMSLPGLPF